jgi:hypothetical protein
MTSLPTPVKNLHEKEQSPVILQKNKKSKTIIAAPDASPLA